MIPVSAATYGRDETVRLTLTRRWAPGPHVCFIGHNPSKATATKTDQTVTRWGNFARAWGYGGFVAVNLYPFYAPAPSDCRAWFKTHERARADTAENMEAIVREVRGAEKVVVCWGAIALDQNYVTALLEEIGRAVSTSLTLWCVGFTASGAPIHVMARGSRRVPDDAKPVIWKTV